MSNEFDDLKEEDIEVVPPDADDESAAGEKPLTSVEKMVKALEQKTKEAAEANDKYLRTYADFENYRKRTQRDLAEFRKYANEQMALELLSVVDHLGLALKHAAEVGEPNQGLRQGVELVYKQFLDVLEKFGIKPFKAEGEPFDPAKHDAVLQVAKEDMPDNTVAQVLQDGYLYYDKVLRHAKVGVSKKPAEPEPAGQGPEDEGNDQE